MNQQLLDRLHKHVSDRSLLSHPFYQDWKAGALTVEDLQLYAAQYYHFEANFPRFLSAIHSRCPDASVRQGILNNLWDEEHGDQNHRALWLGFCAELGLDSDEVQMVALHPKTQALLDTYANISSTRPYQEGLAAVYAYEVQVPEVAAEKLVGLQRWYDMVNEGATAFFQVHTTLDKEHSLMEAEAISEHTDAVDEPGVESALSAGLDAWWSFLDGVNELRAEVSTAV